MKRISLWVLSTVSVVVLLFSYHTSTAGTLNIASSLVGSLSAGTPTSNTAAGGPPAGSPGRSTGNASSGKSTSGNGTSGKSTSGNGSSSSPGKSSASTASQAPSVNGKFTGNTVYTRYGAVQLEITVSKSTITDVTMLQEPNTNSYDLQIDHYVVPILIRESISAQSAHIQMISGATYTSTGYVQSLQSAIDKAGI